MDCCKYTAFLLTAKLSLEVSSAPVSSALSAVNLAFISLRLVLSAANWFLSLLQRVLSLFTIVARGATEQQRNTPMSYHTFIPMSSVFI